MTEATAIDENSSGSVCTCRMPHVYEKPIFPKTNYREENCHLRTAPFGLITRLGSQPSRHGPLGWVRVSVWHFRPTARCANDPARDDICQGSCQLAGLRTLPTGFPRDVSRWKRVAWQVTWNVCDLVRGISKANIYLQMWQLRVNTSWQHWTLFFWKQ